VQTPLRATADALADTLNHASGSTIWQSPGSPRPYVRGIRAGVWVGAQLNEREAMDLSQFCTEMARNRAPVLALLDFPRRQAVDRALELGAAAVLGKPWLNSDLVGTLDAIIDSSRVARAA
jgi:hypothetical protein